MHNSTKVTLDRPAAGKLDVALHVPAMVAHATALALVPDGDVARIVRDVASLFSTGRAEVATRDCVLLIALVQWLSGQQPRTKFAVRGVAEDGTRWSHAFSKGKPAEADPRPLPKKASKELEATLQGSGTAQAYSSTTHFAVDDVIEHASFGRGLVTKSVDNKILVQFLDAVRTLVHARA